MTHTMADMKKVIERRLELARERMSKVQDNEPLDREFISGQISELCVLQDVLWAWMNPPPSVPPQPVQ